jgi:hypothetical protein
MMLFIKGESIILKAVLTSNRKITKSNLVWVSNIDGKLGSESLLELTNLSVGSYIITVSGYGTKIAIQITISMTFGHFTNLIFHNMKYHP